MEINLHRWWPLALAFGAGALACYLVQVAWSWGRAKPAPSTPVLELVVSPDRTYRVARVIDGDTIVLENGLHVRYRTANAPEGGRFIQDPAPLAKEATARTRELVEGQEVRLELGREPLDAYGRVVAHVRVKRDRGEWLDVEATLIREGLARIMAIGLSSEEYEQLKRLEEDAKAAQRGIWGLPPPLATNAPVPWLYCAASRSDVFHRVECYQAKRIAAANFQGYRTLEEVLATGRRACPVCLKEVPAKATAP